MTYNHVLVRCVCKSLSRAVLDYQPNDGDGVSGPILSSSYVHHDQASSHFSWIEQLGFLTKRFNAVSRNSETSETSGYFAKFFACFASVSRNVSRIVSRNILRNVSRNSEKLKISRNNSKIGKLWLTSHLFLFSFSRNKITVSVFRETSFAETVCFAKQRNRRNDPFCFAKQWNAFRETFCETVKNWKFCEIIAK